MRGRGRKRRCTAATAAAAAATIGPLELVVLIRSVAAKPRRQRMGRGMVALLEFCGHD